MLYCSGCKECVPSAAFGMNTRAKSQVRDYTQGECRYCRRSKMAERNAQKRSVPCVVEDCPTRACGAFQGKMLCGKHYTVAQREAGYVCAVMDCSKPYDKTYYGQRLCGAHRRRMRVHGDCYPDIPIGHAIPEQWQQRQSCVYVLADKYCTPIYVGSSFGDSGRDRLWWHVSNQPWADEIVYQGVVSLHSTRGEAYEAEASLIEQYRLAYCLYNKV